jgi:MarR family transcriptional regulator, lower aerobic nicotinate degradation pathway regulator
LFTNNLVRHRIFTENHPSRMNYELLKDIVDHLERFETENNTKKGTLQDFGLWLSNQQNFDIQSNNQSLEVRGNVPEDIKTSAELPETIIAQLLTFLSRYLKIYLKKGLDGTLLTTGDDFSYLATLFNLGGMTKTELILQNAHEKTSGMEVIKRLLINELIEQADDVKDKRSKQVNLTQKGIGVLMQSFKTMGEVAKISAGDLTDQEKNQLVFLLKKLDNFHNDIYLNHREKGIGQLLEEKF